MGGMLAAYLRNQRAAPISFVMAIRATQLSTTFGGAGALSIALERSTAHCLPGREAASRNVEIREAWSRLQRLDRRRPSLRCVSDRRLARS
jgi:hypothetical protein